MVHLEFLGLSKKICTTLLAHEHAKSSPNGYGSIPIDTIFSGMNIHLPAILGFTRYQGFDPSPNIDQPNFRFAVFGLPKPTCSTNVNGLFRANINANQPWHRTSQAMGDHGFFLGRLMLFLLAGFCSWSMDVHDVMTVFLLGQHLARFFWDFPHGKLRVEKHVSSQPRTCEEIGNCLVGGVWKSSWQHSLSCLFCGHFPATWFNTALQSCSPLQISSQRYVHRVCVDVSFGHSFVC